MAIAALVGVGGWTVWRLWYVPGDAESETEVAVTLKDEGTLPATMGDSWSDLDDPSRDGWDTEVASQRADKVLKKLAETIASGATAAKVSPLLSKTFACSPLAQANQAASYDDHIFVVRRGSELADSEAKTHRGADGLVDALSELSVPLDGSTHVECHLKTIGVKRAGDQFVTRQLVTIAGRTTAGMREYNGKWLVQWTASDPLLIESIEVEDFEEVECRSPNGSLFVDATRPVLQGDEAYREQLLRGLNHWLGRLQDRRHFYLLGNPGLALGDVNGDGLDDFYLCQEEGLPNRLYIQQTDGTARDVAKQWGVDWLHSSRGVLLVDLDNDGDQDLVVAMVGHVVVAANNNHQSFEVTNVLPTGEDTMSLSAADYDRDGDLDIYTCVYFANAELGEKARADQIVSGAGDAAELGGGSNTLFRNDIDRAGEGSDAWKFTDVTAEVGLNEKNRRFSFASSWEDFDNDGDQDLYVANDYGRNNLFRNDGGRFTEEAGNTGGEDPAFGMAITWGDFDQDGWMDPYVSNMFSAAGHRITFQDRFLSNDLGEKKRLQRFARGNTLLRNLGQGKFTDVSVDAGVTIGRWSWGSHYVDVNNDSREDLVVANGFITTDDTSDL